MKVYWFVVRPRTTGVRCIIKNEGQILLIRMSYGLKRWTLPGGGVGRGETLEEAVIREVREEVGIEIKTLRKLGSVFFGEEYKRDTMWVFSAKVESREFKIDEFEILKAGWFSPDNLPEPLSDFIPHFLGLEEDR